jgi:hypothetical protein
MDMEHDLGGFFAVLLENVLQDVDDELHRRVIVIQHQYLVHRRFLGPGAGQGQRPATALAIALLVVANAVAAAADRPAAHWARPAGRR